MLLVPVFWANRVWVLPFLTVLTPSERYAKSICLRDKVALDWTSTAYTSVVRAESEGIRRRRADLRVAAEAL